VLVTGPLLNVLTLETGALSPKKFAL